MSDQPPTGPPLTGPRPARPTAAGPRPAGPRAARPTAAGPRPAGPTAAGPRPAGPTAAGPRPAGPTAAGPRPAGPTAAGWRPAGTPPAGSPDAAHATAAPSQGAAPAHLRSEQQCYLVTGASGCLGAWTVQVLLDRGHRVVTYDLPNASDHRLAMVVTAAQLEDVTRVHGDICDLDDLEAAIATHAVTRIIHLAALQVPFVRADPPLGARVNVQGTVNVFQAARGAALSGPVVYASSVAALDSRGTLQAPPSTLYGAFKRANENTAAVYFNENGVSSVGLRPHTVYGPGRDQGLTSEPSAAMLSAAAGRPYQISFGGHCQLQHAQDAAAAFVRASERSYEGASVHNIDGPVASMEQIVAAIEAAVPRASGAITFVPQPLPFPSRVDAGSFVAMMGGPISRPLREGVADAIALYSRLLDDGRVSLPGAGR